MTTYKHWDCKTDDDHIVWLGLDRDKHSVNSINDEVLDELNIILQDIAKQKDAAGLVLYSVKDKGFIAGADVHAFSKFTTPDKIADFLRKGQTVFARLESLTIPTLAMINGFCMGGGLELALACDYRIASDASDSRLGLPEIMLGIHPGWGGTVRLPRLIGGWNALTRMILPGTAVSSFSAKKMGLIDELVPLRQLRRAAIYFIKNKPPKKRLSFLQSLTNKAFVRSLLAPLIRKKIAKRVNIEHYPAPYAVIELWENESGFGERAYLKELDSVLQLLSKNATAENLIRAFLLRDRLKAFGKHSDFAPTHVHVIGAGVMGGDIAMWCAYQGLKVTLQDKSYELIAPALGRAYAFYKKKFREDYKVQAAADRLLADPDGHGLARADVIIEAVFENLAVKQAIMQEVEEKAQKTAIIATNTSSIPLDEISQGMKEPERLVGIHYFNPVAKMELVEIVSSKITSRSIVEAASAFVDRIGRLPLPVTSSPGFLINRVLMPYLLECMLLLEEGHAPESIDMAAKEFGMFMGPVELADTVGLDVCLAVADNLTAHFGGTVPNKLRDMVQARKLGKKTGEGFYRYKNGKAIKKTAINDKSNVDIAQRLIARMINEGNACLREGVVADRDLLDAGMIFGTGFAPFRGGPMNYAKQIDKNKQGDQTIFLDKDNAYSE